MNFDLMDWRWSRNKDEDAILAYLQAEGSSQYVFIPHAGLGSYIVLERRPGQRNHYTGWFFVDSIKCSTGDTYDYKGQFRDRHVWQLASDAQPD